MIRHARLFALIISIAVSQMLPLRATAALSDPHLDVQVSDVEVVNDGANNAIYVRGTFIPALPCSTQGFVYVSTDPLFKEVTALLLIAKSTGRAISYVHVYCVSGGASNGYSRGNGFVLK